MRVLLETWPPGDAVYIVLNVVVQVTVIVLLGLLLTRTIFCRSAAVRHAVWLCCLVCVLMSPLLAGTFQRAGWSLVSTRS
jgi:hypothetical protein